MAETKLSNRVSEILAEAPPLTDDQRAKLRELMRPPSSSAASTKRAA